MTETTEPGRTGGPDAGPPCPRCVGPTELRGNSRTPYCRNCHQFIVDGAIGHCVLHDRERR